MQEAAVLNREVMFFDHRRTAEIQPFCRHIAGGNISLEVIKKAEKSDCRVIRVVETAGRRSKGKLHWRDANIQVRETDLIEWKQGEYVRLDGNIQEITLDPFEIKTFMVK